ncbi:biotin transporter BioY [Paenibacillus sp. FSL F4-0236]|uniref:biotin transporter BioY n=1 Tax=Paenibacillus sp. FSL F4-0236 TaxID=2954731 RepID=UPI0030FA4D0F
MLHDSLEVRTWKLIVVNLIFGVMLINLIGAPIMALIMNTSIWARLTSVVIFLPGDIIKAVIAAIIAI